jgi:hypothetical protein
MSSQAGDGVPRAVQACHELLAWLIPHLDQFPRVRRFTLGERLETGFLSVLEALVEAAYSRDKRVPSEALHVAKARWIIYPSRCPRRLRADHQSRTGLTMKRL